MAKPDKPSDWACGKCKFENWGKRLECFTCGQPCSKRHKGRVEAWRRQLPPRPPPPWEESPGGSQAAGGRGGTKGGAKAGGQVGGKGTAPPNGPGIGRWADGPPGGRGANGQPADPATVRAQVASLTRFIEENPTLATTLEPQLAQLRKQLPKDTTPTDVAGAAAARERAERLLREAAAAQRSAKEKLEKADLLVAERSLQLTRARKLEQRLVKEQYALDGAGGPAAEAPDPGPLVISTATLLDEASWKLTADSEYEDLEALRGNGADEEEIAAAQALNECLSNARAAIREAVTATAGGLKEQAEALRKRKEEAKARAAGKRKKLDGGEAQATMPAEEREQPSAVGAASGAAAPAGAPPGVPGGPDGGDDATQDGEEAKRLAKAALAEQDKAAEKKKQDAAQQQQQQAVAAAAAAEAASQAARPSQRGAGSQDPGAIEAVAQAIRGS